MTLLDERRLPAFAVPDGLAATSPPEASGTPRDAVRMLVSSPDRQEHHLARDLPSVLRPGDLVVVNDSQTLPAALAGSDGDERVELHLSTLDPNTAPPMELALAATASRWVVEVRTPLRVGSRAAFEPRRGHVLSLAGGAAATVERSVPGGTERSRLWLATVRTPGPLGAHLERWGEPIRYDYAAQRWPIQSYRTDVGRRPGSAEMPSAARPLTPAVLAGLEARGVGIGTITLHTGVSSLESGDPPYPEWRRVPRATARAIRSAHKRGGRVLAVGTTVVRALESAAGEGSEVRGASGWTSLMVEPSHPARTVDGILTGWHEPEATHLLMLEAIAGPDLLERSYAEALGAGYRWHEFGDVHLLWRGTPSTAA
ncbi:MAG: S-adenosylmethionine:tRNA ribosyltransferase-isomerase [Candidatus Dormibacteraeota bacterium]|nr:S-adenosylmethionine:tRNA ribosyltransferase-isomerase [Candidatus Dormibacteraeota bacterium]